MFCDSVSLRRPGLNVVIFSMVAVVFGPTMYDNNCQINAVIFSVAALIYLLSSARFLSREI